MRKQKRVTQDVEEVCAAPDCNETEIEARGLCEKHYHQARYEVEIKKTATWPKLEKAGLAKPLKKRRDTNSKFRKAIAELKS